MDLTGVIERFSARNNFSKSLQVSHFHLGFSPGKSNNEMIHFHRILVEILDPGLENTKCMDSLCFLLGRTDYQAVDLILSV